VRVALGALIGPPLCCALVLAWISVIGCVVGELEPEPPLLERVRSQAITQENATPMLAARVMSDADMSPTTPASVHIRHAAQLPNVAGGLPITCGARTRPRTGRTWTCNWLTQAVASYPEGIAGPALRPDLPTALLVTLRPPPEPQAIPGGLGGMLQVPPDYVLVPERVPSLEGRPARVLDLVQDDRGQVRLTVRWPAELAGLSVWCQLLVADGRVPAGCVPTPMVEIHVGRQ